MNTIPSPMSGYELITISKEWRYDHYINATKASFYYALKQLQEVGFIKEIGSKKEANRPEQKTFKIQNKGRKEFQEQISYFLNDVQERYHNIDAAMPFILLFGSILGKQFLLDSINSQLEARKKMFVHADEGRKLVSSHFLFDINPFLMLPLKHWSFHNEAEIKWLELFKTMVESVKDFKASYNEVIKRSIAMAHTKKKEELL